MSHHPRLTALRLAPAPACRLRRLDLRACAALTSLELALPALTSLVLNDCVALERLALQCPSLRRAPPLLRRDLVSPPLCPSGAMREQHVQLGWSALWLLRRARVPRQRDSCSIRI